MAGSRVIVVTGASSGIGRATARAFGSRGDRVALLARNGEALEAAAREVRSAGGTALPIPLDVAAPAQVDAAAARIEEELGPIDVWINDAMVSVYAPAWEIKPQEMRRVMEVNFLGTVHGTLAALRYMRPRDRGVVVQVGSALAYRAIPLQAAYCGSKHAIRGFTESLRCDLLHAGSHVQVTMIQLGAVNTPHFRVVRTRMPRQPRPVAPVFTPERAAESIVLAAEDPMKELVFGGSSLMAILATKAFPGLLDRYLARTGYDAQMTAEPVSPDRKDNLDHPLPGDPGATGPFSGEAKDFSLQFWLHKNRRWIFPVAGGAAVAALGAVARTRAD